MTPEQAEQMLLNQQDIIMYLSSLIYIIGLIVSFWGFKWFYSSFIKPVLRSYIKLNI